MRGKRSPLADPQVAPNPAPFPYHDWLDAKHLVQGAIESGPFYGLITGPSGTGKTCLCHAISAPLEPKFTRN